MNSPFLQPHENVVEEYPVSNSRQGFPVINRCLTLGRCSISEVRFVFIQPSIYTTVNLQSGYLKLHHCHFSTCTIVVMFISHQRHMTRKVSHHTRVWDTYKPNGFESTCKDDWDG